jgi:hypothetical protein
MHMKNTENAWKVERYLCGKHQYFKVSFIDVSAKKPFKIYWNLRSSEKTRRNSAHGTRHIDGGSWAIGAKAIRCGNQVKNPEGRNWST